MEKRLFGIGLGMLVPLGLLLAFMIVCIVISVRPARDADVYSNISCIETKGCFMNSYV